MKEKNKKFLLFIILFGGIFVFSLSTLAHPGNTASDGCHYCRTNCSSWGVAWNQRHCHNSGSSGGSSGDGSIWWWIIGIVVVGMVIYFYRK